MFEPNKYLAMVCFAKAKHEGQIRKWSGEPYIRHPLRVSNLVALADNVDFDMIIAAIGHDLLEDTNTTYSEIENEFGKYVADMIYGLTSPSHGIEYKSWDRFSRKQLDNDWLVNQTDEVKLIKLCDIFDNISSMKDAPENFRRLYFAEKVIQTNLISYCYPSIAEEILGIISRHESVVV